MDERLQRHHRQPELHLGSSASDIWAVGQSGEILRYQNQSWALWPDQVTAHDLYGVRGSDATDVTFVGASGTILRYSTN